MTPERRITYGSLVLNLGLTALKLGAGVWGRSQALIADAIHSLSDFATDVVVLIGLRFSAKPRDENHTYGHGKFETMAAALIGLALGGAALQIAGGALQRIFQALRGAPPPPPAAYGFAVALLSIALKEWLFQITLKVARKTGSPAVAANAWHHRSDALSSIATAAGVGAAAFFGAEWRVLDPIAALFVSLFLLKIAVRIVREQLGDLTDQSLAPEIREEILQLARSVSGIAKPHNLRTRMVGRITVIDLHIRLREDLPLKEAHEIASTLERALQHRFGKETIANLHLEPYSG